MHPDVVRLLECPVCGAPLAAEDRVLGCAAGHSFDVARQGYVNLSGTGGAVAGDTAAMVAARARFLDAGHFAPLTEALVAQVARLATPGAVVVDLGAGTGHHLGAVLDAAGDAVGLALDSSKYAARLAARAHPRMGSVVCDVWRRLPLQSSVAGVVLGIFAPRNVEETLRILQPGGSLVVVTPTPDHLVELVEPLGLLRVDPDKHRRLERDLAPMTLDDRTAMSFTATLDRTMAATVAQMGPSAHHVSSEQLAQRLAGIPEPVSVTCSVQVSVYGS